MRNIIFFAGLMALAFVSCKEQPVAVNLDQSTWDTAYEAAPEVPQTKDLLIEEYTGVHCPNCPAGSDLLHSMNEGGQFAGRLHIVSVHSGILTDPISNEEYNSVQDFRTKDGDQMLNGIFGGDMFKPCAAVDRLKIGNSGSDYFGISTSWTSMMQQALSEHPSTPVNINISCSPAGENQFTIEVKVAYTEAVADRLALSVLLLENDIVDAQSFPEDYRLYTFQHVFRKALSPYNGQEILPDLSAKPAGQVYILRSTLTIDQNDNQQKFWKPENMEVVAFVHHTGGSDKRVVHSQVSKLIP